MGPVDAAVQVSVSAFACALPFEVVGMILPRLSKDVDEIGLEDLALQSFEDAEFPDIRAYFPTPRRRNVVRTRRTRLTLGYVLAIAMLTSALTIAGVLAALWHMAPWVAEAALAAVVASAALILVVMMHSMPPDSEAERRLTRRRSERARQHARPARESERSR